MRCIPLYGKEGGMRVVNTLNKGRREVCVW